MKKTLIFDLLSLNNDSSKYVAYGHLDNIYESNLYNLIFITSSDDVERYCLSKFKQSKIIKLPFIASNFFLRFLFIQICYVPLRFVYKSNLLFNFSGYLYFFFKNQVTLCQNPFPFHKIYHIRIVDKIKNAILRFVFTIAPPNNCLHIFNSFHLKEIYFNNSSNNSLYFKNCPVIYQGVPDIDFRFSDIVKFNKRHDLILFVSALSRHKRLDRLIRIFAYFLKKLPNFNLIVIGRFDDPDYVRECQALILELDLGQHVIFKGFVEQNELEFYYANSKAYVSLSACESFGIPIIQAQSKGLPVFVSNDTAQAEIIGNTGISCEVDDEVKAVNALEHLVSNELCWVKIQKAGLNNVDINFRWTALKLPMIKAINSIIDL